METESPDPQDLSPNFPTSTTVVSGHLSEIAEHGYTVVRGGFTHQLADELVETLDRLETDNSIAPAGNMFEGSQTWRIYNLLALDPIFAQVPVHPTVLPIVEGVLDEGCLVSSISSITIGPGERAQPIHADDQVMPIPKPHPATVCNSMWALTDFTQANGATRVVPGTHLADHSPPYAKPLNSIPAEIDKGDILIWHGSLWHGGGANTTTNRRYGIAMNYCAGWVRQQENQQLGIPLDTIAQFEPRLQQLCGFDTYRRLIGHINRQTPSEVFFNTERKPVIWDTI